MNSLTGKNITPLPQDNVPSFSQDVFGGEM